MRKRFVTILVFFLALCTFPAIGQATMEGQIIAERENIPFANILVQNTDLGTSADENGIFRFSEIPIGDQILVISAIGFRSKLFPVQVKENQAIQLGKIELLSDIFGLEEVVVTGTMKETYISNSPIKVDVYTSKFLEANRSPVSLVETISMINGIEEVIECGVCGTNSIRINGLEGPYTSILIDGTPMFGNLASVYGLNGIPTSLIDKMEVIKGPSSTLYGSEAVAGVINIITKNPIDRPAFSIDVRGTSHGEKYYTADFTTSLGNWDATLGLSYTYVNDYEDNIEDGFDDTVNQDSYALFTKWSKQRPNHKKFFIAGKYYYEDRRNGVEAFLQDDAYKKIRGSDQIYGESIYTNRFELFGTYELPGRENLKLDYSFSNHDQDSYYGADYYKAEQQIAYSNLHWNKSFGKNEFVLGTTFRYQYYDDNTVATRQASRQYVPGIFLQNEWRSNDYFSLLGGIRLDFYTAHGAILAPRLNVKYKTGDWTTFRLNFGTGFRIVNLFTEDHAFITGQREVEVLGDLAPERSYNGTLNFNHVFVLGKGQGSIDFDAFYTYFTNKIVPNYNVSGKIIYANSSGNAISKGIALSVNQSFIFPLALTFGFTLQDVTRSEKDENGSLIESKIEFAPDYTSTGTINYRFKKPDITIAWSYNLTGPMQLPELFDLDDTGNPLENARPTRSNTWSKHVFQVNKRFNKSNLSIFGGIENVFNYTQNFSPLVGFNDPKAPVGFSSHFDTAYTYGLLSGREFYLGIRWNSGTRRKE